MPSGVVSPAHSAMVQQFLRGRSANRPSTNRAALRRGSTRAKRPAIEDALRLGEQAKERTPATTAKLSEIRDTLRLGELG
ncbi:hypothetical protein ACIOHS_48210 [Streptomyces sp. NPDC088253]|uniref:hypothetical protein n=1 Tax=Streptomyces sp. NPDC088253 TaxID=3365846 RepID=UPI003811C490